MIERMFFVDTPVIPIDENNIKTDRERLLEDIANGYYPSLKFKDTQTDHLGTYLYEKHPSRRFSDMYEVEEYSPYNATKGFFLDYYDLLSDFKARGLDKMWDNEVVNWDMPNETVNYWLSNNHKSYINSKEIDGSMFIINNIYTQHYDPQMMNEHADWLFTLLHQLDSDGLYSVNTYKINGEEHFDFDTFGGYSEDWEKLYPENIKEKYASNGEFDRVAYFEDRYEKFFKSYMLWAIPDEHQVVENYLFSRYDELKEKFAKGEKYIILAGIGEQRYEFSSSNRGLLFRSTYTDRDNYVREEPYMADIMSDLDIKYLVDDHKGYSDGKYFGEE